MARLLAIDYGAKRTGIAVTDPLQLIATALETVLSHELLKYLKAYVAREPVEAFIVGLPKRLDGTDTDNTPRVRRFVTHLQNALPDIPVYWHDERFTSVMALQAMIAGGSSKKDRREKGNIDKVSAAIILQSYMESKKNDGPAIIYYYIMILPIIAYGDPILRKRAKDIEPGSIDVKALSETMFETMYAASGVGLAAPQIGQSIRMFVVDGEPLNENEPEEDIDKDLIGFKKVFINPAIIEEAGDDWGFEEGCLSIPGIRGEVFRPEIIVIRYLDTDWNQHEEEYEGMAARIIQHEYDHLDGKLFTDYLPTLRRQLIKKKLADITKGKTDADYRMKFLK